jgi:tRNA threonylcarbamoyladenosine biosynthesis protein TsaB
MLVLAVDTATRAGSFAVLRDTMLLAHMPVLADGPYSTHLLADCGTLLDSAGVSMADIDLFAVSAGPGSFTGLRLGLTAVKAWAEVYGRPIAAVSGLEAVAAAIPPPPVGTPIVPLLDARRGQVFGGLYAYSTEDTSLLQQLSDDSVSEIQEFLSRVGKQIVGASPVFVTPAPEVMRPALQSSVFASARLEEVSPVLAPVIGRLGYLRALRGQTVDALQLDANYVRRTDAEVNWKGW